MKKNILMILYSILIGSIIGFIIWSFIKIMNTSIYFIWQYIPKIIKFPYYTFIVCLLFGIITGLWKKKFGLFPEELEEVINKAKKTGRYEYSKIKSSIISALLPLIGGASIGPEAGLTGIIAGLCTWAGDKFKNIYSEAEDITNIGISSSLATIFSSPLFGFTIPLESDEETIIPKRYKIVLYFSSIISSLGIFILLNNLFKGNNNIESMAITDNKTNYLQVIFLTIIGIILGYIYYISKKLTQIIMKPLKANIIIKCIIGGITLGIIGSILPLTMFSGEEQINYLIENGKSIGITTLLLTGIIKIVLTNICIETELKGGHFFPLIFSGLTIGYAFSLILNIDPVLSMAVVTTSLLAHTLKKPLTTILLLMIVFPPKLMLIMIGVSIFASMINTFKVKNA